MMFYVENMSFNAIRENKILAKISKFTVTTLIQGLSLELRKKKNQLII